MKINRLAVTAFFMTVTVHAQELVIDSLDSNGQLVFNEISNAVTYHVEGTQSLTNAWNGVVTNLQPSGSGSVTCSVTTAESAAMFYRVVAELTVTPPEMVLIPAGTNSGIDPDFGDYSLTVDSFYMDETEVTLDQWGTVYDWAVTNDYSFSSTGSAKGTNHPVVVNWYDAVKWCNARSEMDGRTPCYDVNGNVYRIGESAPECNFEANGYRLPTSDEWEYAARGGLSGKRFPWGDTITHSKANYYSDTFDSYDVSPTRGWHRDYYGNGTPYTCPAGDLAANDYGLYEMAGNVWEWCWELSEELPGEQRCIRGGNYIHLARHARCGFESWLCAISTDADVGFRAVCH